MDPDDDSLSNSALKLTSSAYEMKFQPGVYLIKERTEEEHELHKVFDGEKWYFGAAGISGALQCAELGSKSGEYDWRGPAKPPLRIEVLSNQESKRLARILPPSKP